MKAAKEEAKGGFDKATTRGKVADEYMKRVGQDQAQLASDVAANAAQARQTGGQEWRRLVDAKREFDAADDEVSRLQKLWHESSTPTNAQAYQLALDKRAALVEDIKAGLQAEPQARIAEGQLGEMGDVERTFVGQTEGPPTAIATPAAAGIASQQEGLLERGMARMGERERLVDMLGGTGTRGVAPGENIPLRDVTTDPGARRRTGSWRSWLRLPRAVRCGRAPRPKTSWRRRRARSCPRCERRQIGRSASRPRRARRRRDALRRHRTEGGQPQLSPSSW